MQTNYECPPAFAQLTIKNKNHYNAIYVFKSSNNHKCPKDIIVKYLLQTLQNKKHMNACISTRPCRRDSASKL